MKTSFSSRESERNAVSLQIRASITLYISPSLLVRFNEIELFKANHLSGSPLA
jgi:hypothetical protein